jgi:hypothetical protein
MAKKSLPKELEKQDTEELLRLLNEVARRFPVAKMYLTMEFGLESTSIIGKYKKEITKEYFPTRGYGKARSSKVAKILKEFSLISAFKEDLVDMYWFQIKLAIKFHHTYDYFYEPFMNSLVKNWVKFLELAREQALMETYLPLFEAEFNEKKRKDFLYRLLTAEMNKKPQEEIETDL